MSESILSLMRQSYQHFSRFRRIYGLRYRIAKQEQDGRGPEPRELYASPSLKPKIKNSGACDAGSDDSSDNHRTRCTVVVALGAAKYTAAVPVASEFRVAKQLHTGNLTSAHLSADRAVK